MTIENVVLWFVVLGVVLFVLYCPIFKPWFGFRKPRHRGRWGQ
jgi:hypothetical protein